MSRDEYLRFVGNLLGAALAVSLCASVILFSSCSQRSAEEQQPAPSSSLTVGQAEAVAISWASYGNGRTWSHVMPTGSMLPFMDSRSVLLWERIDGATAQLRKGDVVSFDRGDVKNVCHRIVDLNTTSVYMAGDNTASDGWKPRTSVKMRLCGILYTKG